MEVFLVFLLGGIGAFLLYKGATWLISGSTDVARSFGVPVIVIGFTIVALGTSMPELIVSLIAGTQGDTDLVIGNILGSNMANLGLVLGLGALLYPVPGLEVRNARLETYSLIIALATLYAMVRDGNLSRIDGAILVAMGIAFVVLMARTQRASAVVKAFDVASESIFRRKHIHQILTIMAGIMLMYVGARMMVTNAVAIARLAHVSELLIGLSIVAIGTSLPEVVTSIAAARRRTGDLTVGNALGSNILNVFMVLGLTAFIHPFTIERSQWAYDIPVLLVSTLLAIALMRRGRLTRRHGMLLLVIYASYLVFSFALRNGMR